MPVFLRMLINYTLVRGHTKIPGGECHRHGKGITKEMKRFGVLVVIGVLAWMPTGAQMNTGGSNAHAQWFSHWKTRADDHDVIMGCHKDLLCY